MSSEKRKEAEKKEEKPGKKRQLSDFAGHLIDDLDELISQYDAVCDLEHNALSELRKKLESLTPEQVKKLKGDADTLGNSIEDLFAPAEELQEAISNANSKIREFVDYVEALLK